MTITLTREEAQQVLDALEDVTDGAEEPHKTKEAIETIRSRLNAQPTIECTQIDPVTEDGWSEWQFPIHKGYLMQCCDCGLVHEVNFKVVEKIGRTKKDGSWDGEPTKKGKFRVGLRMRRYRDD
jgi:hypothetical protein